MTLSDLLLLAGVPLAGFGLYLALRWCARQFDEVPHIDGWGL